MGASITLKVIDGGLAGQQFQFNENTACTIGRAKDCDIQIPSDEQEQFISRYHCALDINPPMASLQDLQSKNGTFVNNRKIGPEPLKLRNGDKIKLGRTVFQVEIRNTAEEAPATKIFKAPDEAATQFFPSSTAADALHARSQRRTVRPVHQAIGAEMSHPSSFTVKHFGFRRKPFQGSGLDFLRSYPDYESAYASLLDGIRSAKGLILLLGEPGTGKSLLLGNIVHDPTVGLNSVLCQAPENYDQLLTAICDNLQLAVGGSERAHKMRALMEYMNISNRESIVLIIDDADKMDNGTKRSTISLSRLGLVGSVVLAGTPSLKRQLSQISSNTQDADSKIENSILSNATYIELNALNSAQTAAFVQQQLHVAGGRNDNLFPPSVIERIATISRGIPSAINALCDRALLLTETAGQTNVLPETVNTAASQLALIDQNGHAEGQVSAPTFTLWASNNTTATATKESPALQTARSETQSLEKPKPTKSRWLFMVLFLIVVLLGGAGGFLLWRQQTASTPQRLDIDSRTSTATSSTTPEPARSNTKAE
ncbi:MAG: FHA domain-containing protein [Candidatus Competibacteraceae bacterium]|nr:FHA domain-containing protein [Candidatus Competibacteraceae bacterium]